MVNVGGAFGVMRKVWFSSLYNNAIYLMINSVASSILGFVFWNIMARTFSPGMVGIGSALFAASGLISSLSHLGMGRGMMRFVPEVGVKSRSLVNSVLFVTSLITMLISVIYVVGVPVWSTSLNSIRDNKIIAVAFIVATIAFTMTNMLDDAFLAERSARYVLWKTLITSVVKIPLPIVLFFSLGGVGIFLAQGVAVTLAVLIALFLFMARVYPGYRVNTKLDWGLLRVVLPFSVSNYLAGLLANAIGFLFPLIVFSVLGSEDTAYFSIAWMIAAVISVIPMGISTSLLAECSHCPEYLSHYIKKAFLLFTGILIPAVGIAYGLAPWLLGFFGPSYAMYGVGVLRWLLIANVPIAVNSLYTTVIQVEKRMVYIVLQALATSVLTLSLGYWLLSKNGLAGVGVGYTLANLIVALAVAFPLWCAVRKKSNVRWSEG